MISLTRKRVFLLLLAVCALLALAPMLTFLQSKLIYFPSREIAATPADIGLAYEEVRFTAADGTRLRGWFVPAEGARGVVLHCHGNAGNIGDRLDSIRIFHGLGMSTFIFDYRGYGQSEGSPDEEGTSLDAEAAWDVLVEQRRIRPERVVVLGNSLGGPIAARLCAAHPAAALILESTFTSLPDIAADLYPWFPARSLARFRYDTQGAVTRLRCPLLVIHSRDDEIIPFAHGRRLFEAAAGEKAMLEIAGSHNEGFLLSEADYARGIDRFLTKILGKARNTPPAIKE